MRRVLVVFEDEDFKALTKKKEALDLTWEQVIRRGVEAKA